MSAHASQESKAADELLKQYGRFIRGYKESTAALVAGRPTSATFFRLGTDPCPENASLFHLLESENKLLTRCLIVFYHLASEARKLIASAKVIASRLATVEDEMVGACEAGGEQCALAKFSYSLEDLFDMKFLIQNGIFLAANVVQQYCALFSMEKLLHITPGSIFPSNLDDLLLLLKAFAVFDDIFRSRLFRDYLARYSELIELQIFEQRQRNVEDARLASLQNTLHELDLLVDGNILQIALDNVVAVKTRVRARNLKQFEQFLLAHIKNLIFGIDILGTNLSELGDTDDVLKLNVAVVVYQRMFENIDQKHLRLVVDVNNKYPALVVEGNVMIAGNEFLKRFLPSVFERLNVDVEKVQRNYLNQRIGDVQRDAVQQYSLQTMRWCLRMHTQSRLGNDSLNESMLQSRCELYYEGVALAGEMSFLIKTLVNLHAKFGLVLSKSLVAGICKLTENVRAVRSTYEQNSKFISDSLSFVFQYLQFHALNVVGLCKRKVMTDARKERKFDLATALVLVEKLLYASASTNNLRAIALALNLTEPLKNFGTELTERLLKLLDHLLTLCRLDETVDRVCDFGFLFWHQNLVPSLFRHHMDATLDQRKAALLLEASDDCLRAQTSGAAATAVENLDNVRNFAPFVERHFSELVTRRLCTAIEINLRLDFHSNLQVERFNPFDANSKILMEDRRSLALLPPTVLSGVSGTAAEYVSVQDDVEFYLSQLFYNLTTISLKDWRTYEEMRRLALRKYSLATVDDHLPTQTLEQGIDVLQIMRNIHLFVSRFTYNLNNQVFVEAAASGANCRHLNTVRICNIANSLSTHGFGITNTTVNFVYQFMRKKLSIFSQVLFDERIKSRLAREMKNIRDGAGYSFERALALHDSIKNLESFEGSQSLMDKIRALISSIGNALGYIRMIRSGINNVNSNSLSFVPAGGDDEELDFVALCDGLSATTVKAAECLQRDLGQAMKKIAEGSMYFKMLMSTFSPYFRNSKNAHLRNFYLLAPALTINYIKYMLKAKDRLKKNQNELVFTDDGFSMGLVYMLRLLNQLSDYTSLNWSKTIRSKISADKQDILRQKEELLKTKGGDEKLLQTLLLSEMRVSAFQTEFELLFYNVNSVKIFFQS